MVVADRHEDAVLLRVVEEVVAGALTCGKAAVVALFHDVLAVAENERRAALQNEDVLLLLQVIVEAVRVLPEFQEIDPDPCAPQILFATRVHTGAQRILVMQPTEHRFATHRVEVLKPMTRLRH